MRSLLTVIIVSWNVRDVLRNCLSSLIEDLRGLGDLEGLWRIVVVDSASSDGTPDMARAEFPQVELIASPDNIGYVKGNNLALRRVQKPEPRTQTEFGSGVWTLNSGFCWLLNPDTVVHPGATRALLDFMAEHPRCGLCGPKLVNPDGSLQHGAFKLPGLMQLALETQPPLWRFRNSQLDGRYPPSRYDGPPFRIGHPLGAAMFARVEAIHEVGLLDEGFEMYTEEVDWAARIHAAGWEVWCVPRAVVTHLGGASSAQASERAERLKWQSRQRYYAKHYAPLKRWLAMQLVPAKFRN